MHTIDALILATPVLGLNLTAGTLGDQLQAPGTLLVFLRHSGCMFFRETVADLRRCAEAGPFPPVLMVSQSAAADDADYFARHWPVARVIADPQRQLFTLFGVTRARFGGLFGPAVWTCAARAQIKGHRQKVGHTLHPPAGDPWLLSAMFLAAPDGRVEWFHRARYAGDRPDYSLIPRPGSVNDLPPLPPFGKLA